MCPVCSGGGGGEGGLATNGCDDGCTGSGTDSLRDIARDNAGRTALCRSAETSTTASLKQLVDTDGVDVNLPDKDGRSPLMWAAFKGNAASVEALLQHGNIDKATTQLRDRRNAIHFACGGSKV